MIQFRAANYTESEWLRIQEIFTTAYKAAKNMSCCNPENCRSCHVCADITRAAQYAGEKADCAEWE